jgi:hypothetical protein
MPLFLPISSLVGTVLPELMCYTACTIQVLMCLFVLQHFSAELNCTYGLERMKCLHHLAYQRWVKSSNGQHIYYMENVRLW